MSKAEELSEKYRDFREQCGVKDPIMLNEIEEAYYEGYLQAEKDPALTWRDIADIDNIITEIIKECDNKILYDTEEGFCQEVLNRFNELKGK